MCGVLPGPDFFKPIDKSQIELDPAKEIVSMTREKFFSIYYILNNELYQTNEAKIAKELLIEAFNQFEKAKKDLKSLSAIP